VGTTKLIFVYKGGILAERYGIKCGAIGNTLRNTLELGNILGA
jgi:hypothetical protein